jgi:hypothetical protein
MVSAQGCRVLHGADTRRCKKRLGELGTPYSRTKSAALLDSLMRERKNLEANTREYFLLRNATEMNALLVQRLQRGRAESAATFGCIVACINI